jgi:endonuclease/exonuclease/phosphatase family metal-dependent hydrolase
LVFVCGTVLAASCSASDPSDAIADRESEAGPDAFSAGDGGGAGGNGGSGETPGAGGEGHGGTDDAGAGGVAGSGGVAPGGGGAPQGGTGGTTTAPGPETIRIVTANISFGISAAKVKEDFNQYSPKADVVLVQEARDVSLQQLIDTSVWAVRQNTDSDATRGSAIVVRKSIAKAGGVGGLTLKKGVDASPCPGGGIGTRHIARVDVTLESGKLLRLASAHLPPKRCWGKVYDTMADAVVNVSKNSPGRYVIGGDWNKVVGQDPNDIGKRTGLALRAPPQSIDGFFFRSDKLNASAAEYMAKTNSDHRPVRFVVTVD